MVYIDTSFLAAYYCPESRSDEVQAFLSQQIRPGISPLTEIELFSAVARKVRTGEIDEADGKRILAQFLSHLEGDLFTVIPVQPKHWRLAREWIGLFTTSLRTLDALHLAIASAEDRIFVTFDAGLISIAKSLGVKTQAL